MTMSLASDFLQSIQVLHQEVENDPGSPVPAGFPTLEAVLAQVSPLPEHGLFLGIASDGLPLLLNLKDPTPGSLLVLGDGQTGKTDLLQVVARAASLIHSPRVLRFAIITPFPEEWAGWGELPHCLGLWRPEAVELKGLFSDLAARAEDAGKPETLLLLVDGLDRLMDLEVETLERLRWLVVNGAPGKVWTIAVLNAEQAQSLPNWLGAFRTRIFSLIRDPRLADRFTSMPGASLGTLQSGAQFCIRERTHWLRFWLPLLR